MRARKAKNNANRFPCSKCGAMLKYAPGTQHLTCDYCHHENYIEDRIEEIGEYSLRQALLELSQAQPASVSRQTQCEACGAHFRFAESVHAGECPFCGTAIVTGDAERQLIQPKSLLPFKIREDQAKQQFRDWLKGLWFAPTKVKKYTRDETKLAGVYLPYWTYDSHTETSYTGDRGNIYYENQRVRFRHKGRLISKVKRVPKIQWHPVRGRVGRFFDDVLIGASRSLPRQILDRLQPWDLQNLVSYNEKYLSGFRSEYYQIEVDEGFDRAKQVMDSVITQDIIFDIGGDRQRIHHRQTDHNDTTYKHCLLPVWSAAFRYRGKSYRFVINGRTGQIQGERPYSYWKIGFTAVLGALCLFGLVFFLDEFGMLREIDTGY